MYIHCDISHCSAAVDLVSRADDGSVWLHSSGVPSAGGVKAKPSPPDSFRLIFSRRGGAPPPPPPPPSRLTMGLKCALIYASRGHVIVQPRHCCNVRGRHINGKAKPKLSIPKKSRKIKKIQWFCIKYKAHKIIKIKRCAS